MLVGRHTNGTARRYLTILCRPVYGGRRCSSVRSATPEPMGYRQRNALKLPCFAYAASSAVSRT